MAKTEFRFEDIHGARWIDRLNEFGLQGWTIQNFEYHSSANVWVLFSRTIPEGDGDKRGLLGQTEAERQGRETDTREDTAPSFRMRWARGAEHAPTHADAAKEKDDGGTDDKGA